MSAGFRTCLFMLALGASPLAVADEYDAMLRYLTDTRIDGRALAGASGAIAVNQAAGDLNLQANLRGLAVGRPAGASLPRSRPGWPGADRAGPRPDRSRAGRCAYGPAPPPPAAPNLLLQGPHVHAATVDRARSDNAS